MRQIHRCSLVHCWLATLAFLSAAPSFAYIVFLKDGTQVATKEKYRIEGDKAYLILPSGTSTFIAAAEIDFAKTEEVNQVQYGTATLIEGAEVQQLAVDARFDDTQTLRDIAKKRRISGPQSAKREAVPAPTGQSLPRTPAGYADLLAWTHKPYTNEEIQQTILNYLRGQGLEGIEIFQGTTAKNILIQIVTNSEASVFKTLKDSANALVQVQDRFPQKVEAFEVLMVTEAQQRAGQFFLTADLAKTLVTGAISPETFFLRHVEF